MGGLVGQPRLARSAACCSRATPTATSPPAGRRTPTDAAATRALRGARRAARRAASASSASALGLPRRAGPAPLRDAADARRRALRPRARPGWRRTSYSDITAGAHEARVASEPEEARRRRRAGRRRSPPSPRDGATRRCAPSPSLLGRDAGRRRGRHVRAPRPRGDRLRRAPTSTPSWPRAVAAAQARRPVDLGDPARGGRRAARRRSRRRSGRCSAACGCATSRAPTGSTSSTSSCRSPAATTRPAALDARRDRARVLRAHLPPATRSPATPSGSTTRRCARACAAT